MGMHYTAWVMSACILRHARRIAIEARADEQTPCSPHTDRTGIVQVVIHVDRVGVNL